MDNKQEIQSGTIHTIHTVPKDIKEVLIQNLELLSQWNQLTPLARNEWICWVTIVKKVETRLDHINRLSIQIKY